MEAPVAKIDSELKHQWFSLRVVSGKERVVEDNIEFESKMNDIEDYVDEVFVPFEKVVQIKNNKKQIKERVFFPGYILIKMALTPQSKYVIENTQGVISFVGPKGGKPIPLRDKEVKRINPRRENFCLFSLFKKAERIAITKSSLLLVCILN